MASRRMVIGIDQSYTRTGISIAFDGELFKVTSVNFKGLKVKSEKRREISRIISLILEKNRHKATEVFIICERIRTFSGGKGKEDSNGFLSMNYIKSTAALIATIVDTAFLYGVKVYTVDTRSWKSKILGSSKTLGSDPKEATVRYVRTLGFDLSSTTKTGKIVHDDDAADSACMALYGFIPDKLQVLKLEE